MLAVREGGSEMKKFELTSETKVVFGRTLHRIQALISFGNVEAGDLGGWIETEDNLAQDGNAWVCGDARVYDNAGGGGDARVYGNARVCGNAWVCGDARVYDNAWVCGDEKWMVFGPAGSRNDFTTFFACADGSIGVKCGCFYGNLDDFAKKVQARHRDNDHAKVYKAAIEVAKLRIRVDAKEAAES